MNLIRSPTMLRVLLAAMAALSVARVVAALAR
jgi:hypothetical protein